MTGLVRRFVTGNAIVSGACVQAASPPDKLRHARAPEQITERPFPSNADWPVRNQGPSRGTCNAFAMVAADELWNFRQANQTLATFSEEYLYAKARSKTDLSVLNLDAAQEAKLAERIAEDGSTFLFQVREALATDGQIPRDVLPYDADPSRPANYEVAFPNVPEPIQINAALVHDIDVSHLNTAASAQVWQSGDTRPVSDRIRDALAQGFPVAAAFYFLDAPFDTAWYGLSAQVYGLVRYPENAPLEALRVVGAHSVCIVDFKVDAETGEEMFIFRNSWGEHEFGSAPWKRPNGVKAPHRGYGLISRRAVDQFCWEIIHRQPPPAYLS